MAKFSLDEWARAREAFEAWAKAQIGCGVKVWEAETSLPVQRVIFTQGEKRAELVPVPFDWDDLDVDQQQGWVDVAKAMDAKLEEERKRASENAEAATHAEADRWAIGERLGLAADECPTAERIIERIQELLTELSNSVPRAESVVVSASSSVVVATIDVVPRADFNALLDVMLLAHNDLQEGLDHTPLIRLQKVLRQAGRLP
jgi:hypothetical protein